MRHYSEATLSIFSQLFEKDLVNNPFGMKSYRTGHYRPNSVCRQSTVDHKTDPSYQPKPSKKRRKKRS